MALSPWPTAQAEIDAATTTLAAAIGASESVAGRLGPVVAALVERYAEHAPDAVKDEAVIRSAGWLNASKPGLRKVRRLKRIDIEFSGGQSALRLSGSMSLLSPWKVRRAGRI